MAMVSSTMFRRLALLARVKSMRLRIALQHTAKQVAIVAFALLLAVGGVGMLMFCLFVVTPEALGIVGGALTTGALLLAIAGAAIAISSRLKAPAEAQMLDTVEQTLVGEISAEIEEFESGFKRLETGTSALFKGDYLTALASFAGGLK